MEEIRSLRARHGEQADASFICAEYCVVKQCVSARHARLKLSHNATAGRNRGRLNISSRWRHQIRITIQLIEQQANHME